MSRAGLGHLERLPSGSYRISVYSGIDPLTGRQLRHRRTARTEEQARIVLGRLLEQASTGQRPGTDVRVEEVLTQYLAIAELEPSTRETYEGYIRLTAGQRPLEERLQAARSNNRFLDKRIAGLEAQLLAAKPGT